MNVHYRVHYCGVRIGFAQCKIGVFQKLKKSKLETHIAKKVTGNAQKKHFRLLGAEGGI